MKHQDSEFSYEYPFGFGFALMQNPRAIQHFSEMTEWQKREIGRKLRRVSSEQELKSLIDELALRTPKA